MKRLLILFILSAAATAQAQWSNGSAGGIYYNGGVVGIGLPNPTSWLKLQVAGSTVLNGIYAGYNDPISLGNSDNGQQIHFGGTSSIDLILEAFAPYGNVGIGTTVTSALLTVGLANGTGTKVVVNGDVVVNGNINAKYGQDIAEWVPASGDMAPGTVVTVSPSASNTVVPSQHAYDTRVAGVVSAQPGLILGERAESRARIATTGRVKVRVDARRRPVALGDLLVTSDIPGVAMVSEPVEVGGIAIHRPGTLIGKALEPLLAGEGEILVLLSLQ
jgi:hypothetical protein